MILDKILNNLWESKNKNWRIEIKDNRIFVQNLKTGECDTPIIYNDRHTGFDAVLPKYIVAAVKDYANGLFIWNDYGNRIRLITPGGLIHTIYDNREEFRDYIGAKPWMMRGVCTSYVHIIDKFVDCHKIDKIITTNP